MAASASALFSEEVVAFLTTDKLGDPLQVTELSKVTYETDPDGSRMGGTDAPGTFKTVEITDEKTAREALLNASLGSLLNRQEMYGALLRYPRTLVLGPDAAFACVTGNAAGIRAASQWATNVSAATSKVSVRDFDQIVWVNHCAEEIVGRAATFSGTSPPMVEINVAILDHARRSASELGVVLHRARFAGSDDTDGFGGKIADQFVAVMANLGARSLRFAERKTTAGYNYTVVLAEDTGTTFVPNVFGAAAAAGTTILPDDKYNFEYVKHAVAALERVMRGSVFKSSKPVRTPGELLGPSTGVYASHPELVYTAVLSGVVPYGINDINDAKTRRPAPIPGAAPKERIIDVMRHLLGYGQAPPVGVSQSGSATSAAFSATYGAMASAMRADSAGSAAAEADNVSPYALVSASLARNAEEASAMCGDDVVLGLGLNEDDMSSSDDDDADYSSGF